MKLLRIFLFFYVGLLISAAPLKLTNETYTADVLSFDDFTPEAKIFSNKQELFLSAFWKQLLQGKMPHVAASTVIVVKDTQSVYHFDKTELEIKDLKGRFLQWPLKRKIRLLEVQYGEQKNIHWNRVPVSSCISSKLGSGGASYTQSYSWSKSITKSLSPSIDFTLMQLGATLSLEADFLSLSITNTGSITCNAAAGKKVQVFGSFILATFPLAQKREATFSKGYEDFKTGEWIKLSSDDSESLKFGPMFFDLEDIPDYVCIDNEDDLRCDDESLFSLDGFEMANSMEYISNVKDANRMSLELIM
ncbi:uncharacterized protein PRCAT00002912001 [Priceomyces carsonii]|uniref:uncharacterized protein n=1 Tax=Priceomyces carsonii TaxID=28549 RepID=UPI002EDA7BAD|nr:unnamed protein product [Priceomyces carsonii]